MMIGRTMRSAVGASMRNETKSPPIMLAVTLQLRKPIITTLEGPGTTPYGAGISPAPAVYLPRLIPRYGSFDRTSVPAAESIPPIPFTSEILALGTWRAPHSPRSWRVASIMGKMPYIPECV
jgi:hypothetical protein